MADDTPGYVGVAPFRMTRFHSRMEFEAYLTETEALRGNRWLYEQSLATPNDAVVLSGTCGLCLSSARFTAPTRGGETTGLGRVPNWREGLVCDCNQRLINRERALMHYLLDTSSLQPWMRVLGLGLLESLRPMLIQLSARLTYQPGPLDTIAIAKPHLGEQGYHLIVSVEQFGQPGMLSTLASRLVPGGQLVFTAPFDATGPEPTTKSAVGWSILDRLCECGFADAQACTYWSEEFGYLGPFNFIFSAVKDDSVSPTLRLPDLADRQDGTE